MGGNLSYDQFKTVSRSAQAFHAVDPMRPIAVDVSDGCQAYSRGVEQVMLGIHRWPLLTGMELTSYRDWLTQRRQLAQPGAFCWTWIQTHMPDWFLATAYDRGPDGAVIEPLGPQAEQIRLMAYTAIGSGYRGLGFWSDRFLADSHTGRDRLLALALLNQEMEMLEPILMDVRKRAGLDRHVAAGGQGGGDPHEERRAGAADVDRRRRPVRARPGRRCGAGRVRADDPAVVGGVGNLAGRGAVAEAGARLTGATRVSLHDFSLTAAIVFTGDLGGAVVQFQNQQRRMAPTAAQWAHDQAAEELAKAEKINAELEQLGRRLPDGANLLQKARDAVERSARLRQRQPVRGGLRGGAGGPAVGAHPDARRTGSRPSSR